MVGSGRVVGLILVVIGILTCLIGSTVAISSVQSAGAQGTTGGMVLGIAFSALPALLFVGVGAYLFTRGVLKPLRWQRWRSKRKFSISS